MSTRTSSSCLPTMFFFGHETSSSLEVISSAPSSRSVPNLHSTPSKQSSSPLERHDSCRFTHFVISLSLMILLSSSATAGETNTVDATISTSLRQFFLPRLLRTLFPDQRIVSVIRVVGVSDSAYTQGLVSYDAYRTDS